MLDFSILVKPLEPSSTNAPKTTKKGNIHAVKFYFSASRLMVIQLAAEKTAILSGPDALLVEWWLPYSGTRTTRCLSEKPCFWHTHTYNRGKVRCNSTIRADIWSSWSSLTDTITQVSNRFNKGPR